MSCAVDPFVESDAIGRWRRTILRDGCRIGMLRVVGEARDLDGARVVRLVCDCGRPVEMTNGSVMRRARVSSIPVACADCTLQMREARADRKQSIRERILLSMWERSGSLYGDTSWIEADILEALESEIAPIDRAPVHIGDVADGEESVPSVDRQQRMATLFPIGGDDTNTCWKCVHCGSFPSRCFGCVECGETACIECVRSELHAHVETGDETLASLARLDGVSRERIRQVERRAIGKLLRPCRRHVLGAFLTDSITDWERSQILVAEGKLAPDSLLYGGESEPVDDAEVRA